MNNFFKIIFQEFKNITRTIINLKYIKYIFNIKPISNEEFIQKNRKNDLKLEEKEEEKYINLSNLIIDMYKNYKIFDKKLLEIYTHYFRMIKKEPELIEININNELFIPKFKSDKILSRNNILFNDSNDLNKIRKHLNQNKITKTKHINEEKIKDSNIKLLNKQLLSMEKIRFVNFKFDERYIDKFKELENKNYKFFKICMEEYNKLKNIKNINKSYNLLIDLRNKWINEIHIKNVLLETRKNLNYLKKVYDKEWICSIDCEYQKNKISEIGISLKNIKTKKLIVENYIIEDFKFKKQIYTKFNFGVSEVLPLNEALKRVKLLTEKVNVIVGNEIKGDIKLLKINGLNLEDKFIFDLNNFKNYFKKSSNDGGNKTLSDYSYMLGIEGKNFHNSGNDAYYSVRIFFRFMEKYLNMDFELPNDFKNLSEKQIDLNNTKDNIKRKITFIKSSLKNKKLIYKELPKEKINFIEHNSLSDISILFKEYIKNSSEEIKFISIFKEEINYNLKILNFKKSDNLLFLDVHNYIVFIRNMIIKMGINIEDFKFDEKDLIYLLTNLNLSKMGRETNVHKNEDNFIFRFYDKENKINKTKLNIENDINDDIENTNEIIILKNRNPEYKNTLSRLNNVIEMKIKPYKVLIEILNKSITNFSFDEIPKNKYKPIIDSLIEKESKKCKIEKIHFSEASKRIMIDLSNIKEIFVNKEIKIEEFDFFNPEKSKNTTYVQKINYFYLKENNGIFYDTESFIFAFKVFCNMKKITTEDIKYNLIEYIKKYNIKSNDFHNIPQNVKFNEISNNKVNINEIKNNNNESNFELF